MTWEFKTLDRGDSVDNVVEWLIGLAADGWKLVTFRANENGRVVSIDVKRQTP